MRHYLRVSLGISKLKQEQRKAIDAFVNGKDVFVCLPTRFGKTVCRVTYVHIRIPVCTTLSIVSPRPFLLQAKRRKSRLGLH